MVKPSIVQGSEKKRLPTEREPPSEIILHEWGKPFSAIDIYVSRTAIEKIMKHSTEYGKKQLEVMGFMVGDRFVHLGKEYTIVKDVVTSDLDTTSVSVKFSDFERCMEQLDGMKFDYVIVGWYHSHPGHTCFMSATDVDTQKRMFKQSYHSALVCDPINKEMKVYRLVGNEGYSEVMYAVFLDEDGAGKGKRKVVKKVRRKRPEDKAKKSEEPAGAQAPSGTKSENTDSTQTKAENPA